MGCRTPRRTPGRASALASGAAILFAVAAAARTARADRNDLRLINLCDTSATGSCPWVTRTAPSTTVFPDADAAARFRSLMSELGVVAAPSLQTPADTL